MRQRYEMTDQDLEILLNASKPTLCMEICRKLPRSPQENANEAWRRLGDKIGFDHMTVRPVGNDIKVFTAESKEAAQAEKEK